MTFGGADGPGYGTNWDRRRSAWGRRDVLGRRRPPYGMTRLRLGGAWSAWADVAYLPPFGGFGGGASRSREAAGEGRRNHQRGTGQISAKTGESVATRPRRRTRRLQCDVSGATLTEIEGPGTSSGAYGRGGGGAGGRAGGRDRAWDERKGGQSSCDGPRGRTGRGDVIRWACDSVHPWGS